MYSRILPPAMPIYEVLHALVKDKPHFVITTNVDGQFRKAGFEPERLFEVQGDYAFIQRADGADGLRRDATDLFRAMYARTSDCRVPGDLVPRAADGAKMDINIRKDDCFVEDEEWHRQAEAYYDFVRRFADKRLLLLELGVGFNTPTIIRMPFEQMAEKLPQAYLVRLNRDYPQPRRPLARFSAFTTLDVATLRSLAGC